MYSVPESSSESSDVRRELPVGTILAKQDPRVCHSIPSSSYRLRAGDHVAIREGNHAYMVYKVIDPDVNSSIGPCFSVKAQKQTQRTLQHGADLIHKLVLTPVPKTSLVQAEACDGAIVAPKR